MRFLAFLVLFSALAIAGCAAYFSIIGLKLLFVGGGISIVIMGTVLEVGKLVAATYLNQKWNQITMAMRTYLILATLLLVSITSIGIYGYLSSGYNATNVAVQGYERQVEVNTLKISEFEKEIGALRQDTYNESEISAINENRKTFIEQRLQLINQRNAKIDKIRSDAAVNVTTEDTISARQALELAKSALDSDTERELTQIKLYNSRLEVLDKEVQKWLDEGRGSIFRKGGLDKARETRDLQATERAEVDALIKKSQDRIDTIRLRYDAQVKDYNERLATIDTRTKDRRSEVEVTIKSLEKENAETVDAISLYNKESDEKIVSLNIRKGELSEQNSNKITKNQENIKILHIENDALKQSIVHTDVGTFKFIAKSLNIPLDNAVNYFTLMIMIVFDPLAVCLILAYNAIISGDEKKKTSNSPVSDAPIITPPNDTVVVEPPKEQTKILLNELPVERSVEPEPIKVCHVESVVEAPTETHHRHHKTPHGLRENEVLHTPSPHDTMK